MEAILIRRELTNVQWARISNLVPGKKCDRGRAGKDNRLFHLAARLDLSERHLERSFQATFGMSPKRFARIARIERVWSARGRRASWADIAYATGFTDQAHMVNDFTKIVGVPPAQLEDRRGERCAISFGSPLTPASSGWGPISMQRLLHQPSICDS
jgi:AraC-like DNA-binding protein